MKFLKPDALTPDDSDDYRQWWLDRYPLAELRDMARHLEHLDDDMSRDAQRRPHSAPKRVAYTPVALGRGPGA